MSHAPEATPSPPAWQRFASQSGPDALAALASSSVGLSGAEAARRLAAEGKNELPRPRRRPWWVTLGRNFTHFFALLLWVGAALSFWAAMPELAVAIVVVILVNGLFSFWQEHQAERAVEALLALLPQDVTVRRGGEELRVPASEVVRGDVLVLSEGDLIPADARLLRAERMRLDSSSLTGESRPVPRAAEPAAVEGRTASQLPNLVFAGTSVVSGAGEAVVYAVAGATELGRIAHLSQLPRARPSPLEQELARVTRTVTFIATGMGLLCFLAGALFAGLSTADALIFAIGIIVANVPEGLLPTMTLALAMGVRRMAARNALVKRLSAVEALGACSVILTDKTGTLTQNAMTVQRLWTPDGAFTVGGSGWAKAGALQPEHGADPALARRLLRAAALCCEAHLQDEDARWKRIGDPTEAALLVAAEKVGLDKAARDASPRLAELPFDSARRRMTTVHAVDGAVLALTKGATLDVLACCASELRGGQPAPLDEARRAAVVAAQDALAERGLRVLAVAERALAAAPSSDAPDAVERELCLLGLVAMEDPPRPEVPAAVAACRAAGLRVYMVTGDAGATGAAIGREIGLYDAEVEIVTGAQLEGIEAGALERLLGRPNVLFARMAAEQKLALVSACQRRGDVVAVTGDGVNDAPALKRADIGVAMGASGTDVARAAADMILTDDNFATIAAAIEEGRSVYDNVRKFVTYIFASNIPEIVPFVAFVLLGIPLPLTVMQILAVDLGTDLVPAVALGAEPPEPDAMQRPPRPPSARLLDAPTLARAYGWLGLIEAAAGLLAFFAAYVLAGWERGAPMASAGPVYATATTMSFAAIVACQVGNLFACRSARLSSLTRLGKNRLLAVGLVVELAALLALVYVPPLARAFGFAPLAPQHWALLAIMPPSLLALEELRKLALRRRERHESARRGGPVTRAA